MSAGRRLLITATLLTGCGATQLAQHEQPSLCVDAFPFFAEWDGLVFTIDESHRLHTIQTRLETASSLVRLDENLVQVVANGPETCALTQEGTVFCWGAASGRYHAHGAQVCQWHGSVPKVVLHGARSLGWYFGRFCALTQDDGIVCWGWDSISEPGSYDCAPLPIVNTKAVECGGFSRSGELCWRTPVGVTCWESRERQVSHPGFSPSEVATIYQGGCACVSGPEPSLRCCSPEGDCHATSLAECPTDILAVLEVNEADDSEHWPVFALLSSGPVALADGAYPDPESHYAGETELPLSRAVRGLDMCIVEREPLQVRCRHDEHTDIAVNREGEVSFVAR
jgi:hypothetical protein